jgi:glycosyltransferase involved in cell wall biosynthesis
LNIEEFKPKLEGTWNALEKNDRGHFRWSFKSSSIVLGEEHPFDQLKVIVCIGPNTDRLITIKLDSNEIKSIKLRNSFDSLLIPIKNIKNITFEVDKVFIPGEFDNRELGIQFYTFDFIRFEDNSIKKFGMENIVNGDVLEEISPPPNTTTTLDEEIKSSLNNTNLDIIKINIDRKHKDLKGILYVGQYGTCGYAVAAKGYIYTYFMEGVPITWQPLRFDDSVMSDDDPYNVIVKSLINKKIEDYSTVVLHCTPDLWQGLMMENVEKWKDKIIVGYAVWESYPVPKKWVECMNNSVHMICCPSNYNKKIFQDSGVRINVEVVPHRFLHRILPDKERVHIKSYLNDENIIVFNNEEYTFYNISEFNYRKGIEDLINVFCQSFTKEDKVRLVLKLHYKDYSINNKKYCINKIKSIISKYENPPKILYIVDNLSDMEIMGLHSIGNCYVSLTKSEAFGLTIFDAFNYNKKIICTGYSGMLDYLGDNYEGLVRYTLGKVENMKDFSINYNEEQEWAYPDLEHSKELMRKMINI